MTTLMRNGRDRRSGKPVKGHAKLERALLVGTRSADHIRASGHNGCIATGQASTRKQAGYMAAPERFAKRQIHLAPRAPSIHGPLLIGKGSNRPVSLGLTDHVWSIGELLDAALATQSITPTTTAPDRRKRFRVTEGGKK